MWVRVSLPPWDPNVTLPPNGVSTALHAQTHLYSVKYLFLHYFTRVVFTKQKKTKQNQKNLYKKIPKKYRHAKKKK